MSRVQHAVISVFDDKKNKQNLFNITKKAKKTNEGRFEKIRSAPFTAEISTFS